MSYELLLEAKPESKAKILGIPVKYFLDGQMLSVSFKITNLGEDPFPSGTMEVRLTYFESQVAESFQDIRLPKISPKESVETEKMAAIVACRGAGFLRFTTYRAPIRRRSCSSGFLKTLRKCAGANLSVIYKPKHMRRSTSTGRW